MFKLDVQLMRKTVFIILLFFSLGIASQELKFQGHLLGDEKQDLESATVRCYTSDTVFVAGTTTNMKGLFEASVQLSRL